MAADERLVAPAGNKRAWGADEYEDDHVEVVPGERFILGAAEARRAAVLREPETFEPGVEEVTGATAIAAQNVVSPDERRFNFTINRIESHEGFPRHFVGTLIVDALKYAGGDKTKVWKLKALIVNKGLGEWVNYEDNRGTLVKVTIPGVDIPEF